MSHTCPACEGRTFVTIYVPNVRKSGGVEYVSPIPAPTVPRNYRCTVCHGRGWVACLACCDDGEVAVADADGEFDHLEPCDCTRGKLIAEQRDIDAVKARWEATLPDYDAIAHANIAAGNEPW